MRVKIRKLICLTTVLAVLLGSGMVSHGAAGNGNLLADGGFESALVAGDAPGYDHTQVTTGRWVNVCWCEPFEAFKQEGSQSLKICYSYNGLCTDRDFPGVYQDVAVSPHSVYKLTFWARVDNSNKHELNIGYRDPNGFDVWANVENHVISADTFDTSFRKYEYELTVGNLDQIRVYFYCTGQGGMDYRAFYIDEVSLVYDREAKEEVVSSGDVVIGDTLPLVTDDRNLLANSDFEQAINPADTTQLQLGKWSSLVGGYDGQNDGGIQESMCAKITYQWEDGLSEDMYTGIYQDVEVEKNTTYQFSVYIKKWWDACPDNEIYLGFANAKDPSNSAVYHTRIQAQDLTAQWVRYTVYFNTGNVDCARLFLCAQGQSGNAGGGYNLDNSSLTKVTGATEHASFANSIVLWADSPYVFIGESGNRLQVARLFTWQYRDPLDLSEVAFTVENPELVTIGADGTLQGKASGSTRITATWGSYSAEITVLVKERGQESIDCILESEEMSVGGSQNYYVVLTDAAGSPVPDEDYSYHASSSDPTVLMLYSVGDSHYLYGVSQGTAQLVVEAEYLGEQYSRTIDITVSGKDLLIDGGFEFYNELSQLGVGWKFEGTGGWGIDYSVDNTLSRTGKGNVWCMAPVYWDAAVAGDSSVKIYQDVDVQEADLYTFAVYIKRFYANGTEGTLMGYGGNVSLGIVPLDSAGEELDAAYIEYGIDTGVDAYERLSCTRELAPGRYRVVISIRGDSYFGLGMQLDDASLETSSLPKEIFVSVGDDNTVNVGDLEPVVVQMEREDGTVETVDNARILSLNREIAIITSGYLVANAPGTVQLKVVYPYEGQELSRTIDVLVLGEGQEAPAGGFRWWMAVIPAAAVAVAAAVVVVILVKKRRKGVL